MDDTRAGVAVAAVVIISLTIAGCGSSPTAPTSSPPATDAIGSVTSMVPTPGTTLAAGQTVTFSGTPGYTLASADVGMVLMAIEDQNDRPLDSADINAVAVHRGDGDATITRTIDVPAQGVTSIHLYFLLVPGGAASTNAAVRLTYPVR